MRKYFLLCLSGFAGASAFVWPSVCWWLVFFFMIPLFLFVIYFPDCISWRSGLLWGISFFGLQSSWIVWLMREKSQAPFLGLIIALLFIGFCAVHSSAWFILAGHVSKINKAAWFIVLIFGLTGIAFWWWIDRGMFWITGQCDGYPLVFPVLPLAVIPQFLVAAPSLSMTGLLFFLVTFASFIALFICYNNLLLLMSALICLIPFVIGFFFHVDQRLPGWSQTVGYVSAPCASCSDPYERARCIGHLLAQYHELHPQVRMIVMPESTCAFALNEYPRCVSMWNSSLMDDDIILVMGGHDQKAGNLFNTFYCMCKGSVVAYHHKTHCFPLVEHIPAPWSRLSCMYSLFLSGYCPFSAGNQYDQVIQLDNHRRFIPMICSELFFAKKMPSALREIPVLAIVNDSWFVPYARQLLYLVALSKAIAWQRVVLYVGHYGAFWMLPDGSSYRVETIAN